MQEMPEFVIQLEQASGLPWWCLLLIAVMALIIIVLAASLSRAKKRARVAAVDIPRGGGKASEASASKAESDESSDTPVDAETHDVDGADGEDVPSESAVEDEAASERGAENPESEDSGVLSDKPTEPEAGEPEFEDESAENAVAESADDSATVQAGDAGDDESANEPPVEATTPKIEVLEADRKKTGDMLDLNDDEILKATAGSHGRIGQSAFGIDFGFLEEYEAEYEQAFNEFRRLRTDLGGKAPTGPADRFSEE